MGHLDILGIRYNVIEQKCSSWPSGQMGLTDHHQAVITLGDDMADDVRRNTLLHEVVHAIFALQGIDQNEGLVSQIATGLASIPQLKVEVGK
jgi:Zn-dependent peptidase ImmA (M78 family)